MFCCLFESCSYDFLRCAGAVFALARALWAAVREPFGMQREFLEGVMVGLELS